MSSVYSYKLSRLALVYRVTIPFRIYLFTNFPIYFSQIFAFTFSQIFAFTFSQILVQENPKITCFAEYSTERGPSLYITGVYSAK